MKLIMQFIKPHWKMCLATILLLIVDVTGALYISTLAAEMLNLGTSGASFDMLLNTGLQMAVASIVSSACAILGGYACAALSARVGKDMRVAIYEKSMKLSIYDFRHFGTASITTRTVSDITTIQFALTSFIQMVMPVPVIFIVALALAFRLDVEMGFILLAVVVVVFILALFIMNSAAPLFRKLQKLLDRMSTILLENITGVRVVRAFNNEKREENRMGEAFSNYAATSIQSAFASAKRTFQLLDDEEEIPDPEKPAVLEKAKGHIAFRRVSFGYNPGQLLMKNISFEAKPGQKIAVVGSTGAGKTTLVNLLMRFYEVNDGKITLDGVNAAQMTRSGLRKNFGMVLQDTWLFGGTVAENIAYGRPNATREEIVAAAKAAKVDYFIRTMPQGYDTMLNNEAANLSAGQRQLITIARVFLCDPPLIILDEATSSVDTRTEAEIGKAMKKLMSGRTSFVIAHRLSTIRDADTILFMEHGNIIEQGNHKELLAKKGAYAALYYSQFE